MIRVGPWCVVLAALAACTGRTGFTIAAAETDARPDGGDPQVGFGDAAGDEGESDGAAPGDATDAEPAGDGNGPSQSDVSVTAVSFLSADGDYVTGTSIEISVTFSAPVTLGGAVSVTMLIGFDTVALLCAAGGPATSVVCGYTVGATDLDLNGVTLVSPVVAAGGTIVDGAGLPVVDLDFVPPDGSGITVNVAGYVPSPWVYTTNASTCITGNFRGSAIFYPSIYYDTPDPVPVIFFLHGAGEESTGTFNPDLLDNQGIPLYLTSGNGIPFLTFMPQMLGGWAGHSAAIRAYVECMLTAFPRADRDRVYITGLSSGGEGTFTQVSEHYDLYAAAAPIAGFRESGILIDYDAMRELAMWAFHGDADATVNIDTGYANTGGTRTIINAWNANPVAPRIGPKFTIFAGAGHSIWNQVYNGSWLTTETPPSLYTWFLSQRRDPALFADVALSLVDRALAYGGIRLGTQQNYWEVGRDLGRARALIDRLPQGGVGSASEADYLAHRDALVATVDESVTAAENTTDYLAWTMADRALAPITDPAFDPLRARLAAVTPGAPPLLVVLRSWGTIPVPRPWNDLNYDCRAVFGPRAVDWADGLPSGISVSLTQVFGSWEAAATGSDAGVWPDAAWQRGFSLDAGTARLELTGLAPAASYRVTLSGRTTAAGSATRYRIGVAEQTLTTTNNLAGVVVFDAVADAGGLLAIEVEAVSGRGVLSGFILERR